ncbi:hypothetical protein JB92DRAFT_1561407 [Gautieria morchelliformis]|nr:hypothetical protein JB92DRAFT_1561407 [Gautieria morchelliformis]
MRSLNIARAVLFGLLILFSFVTIGLAGSSLSTVLPGNFPLPWVQIDVAVPVLSLVVVIPSLVIDFFRKGAFTSMVVVELTWTSVFSILWLAAAGATTAATAGLICGVDNIFTNDSECGIEQGLTGVTWMCCLILLGWNTTLFVYAIMAHSRGNRKVWTSPVTGMDLTCYSSPSMTNATPASYTSMPIQQQQIPQYQHQGYPAHPQGYPPTGYSTVPPQRHYTPMPQGAVHVQV